MSDAVSEPPRVIVIAGPNGAGKSTAAPFLLRDLLGIGEFVNADVIAQGLSAFEPERAALPAGRIMLQRLKELAGDRVHFAFETTLASRSFAPWIRSLCNGGFSFHLFFRWLPSPNMAVQRVALRVSRGGHHVPEDTIRRRYERGLYNLFSLYRPLAESWAIFDNSRGGDPQLIAGGARAVKELIAEPTIWGMLTQTYDRRENNAAADKTNP